MAINRKFQNFLSGVMPKAGSVAPGSGLIPLVYCFETAGGATESESVVVSRAMRVYDAHVILKGAGTSSDAFQILNGSDAISDSVSIASAGDKDIVRIGEVDDAYYDVAAGGTLKVTVTDGGGSDVPALKIYVYAYAYEA